MRKLILPLLAVLLRCSPALGAAGFVQQVDSHWFGASGVSESVVFPSNIGAGHLISCAVTWVTTTSTISTFRDGNSTNYAAGDTFTDGTAGTMSLFSLANSSGGANPKTVTVTWGVDPGAGSLTCQEISGVAISSPIDVHAIVATAQVSPGTGANAVTSPSVTPGQNGEYIYAATFDSSTNAITFTAGTTVAYTGTGTNGSWFYSEYFVQSTAAALAGTFTVNITGGHLVTAIVTFKPSGVNLDAGTIIAKKTKKEKKAKV